MTVHPEWQRQGVASMLMKSGLDIADRYQQKAFVIGTSEGAKLYESMGFKAVEILSTDYSHFGGIGPYVNHFMVREPVLEECYKD
jgi:predicted N-acetyltransferase YhbS